MSESSSSDSCYPPFFILIRFLTTFIYTHFFIILYFLFLPFLSFFSFISFILFHYLFLDSLDSIMRDINFRSIPFNRASVSITAALYDKRALDCTSDRPLIYSLNHLIYLASSSARVRETLAMDGGIERLASILRECIIDQSTKKPFNSPADEEKFKFFAAWKWTLALQCMVFISTRGSEEIRRRVVSCGILPIIATVLKNYIEIMAKPKSTRCESLSFTSCLLSGVML